MFEATNYVGNAKKGSACRNKFGYFLSPVCALIYTVYDNLFVECL